MLPDRLRVASVTGLALWLCGFAARPASAADPGVAVLLVDTDRVAGTIDERIYGHFLEEINHSAVDGLHAEQVRGQGFEGKDVADYWTPFGRAPGRVAARDPGQPRRSHRSVALRVGPCLEGRTAGSTAASRSGCRRETARGPTA